MKKLSWDQYFMSLAYVVASRSECLDKQVGCVIVDQYNRVIGTGYNGFPTGAENPCEKECMKEHGKPCGMVHAELNAMLYTDMTRAHKMYITLPPCSDCLRHIKNTPIIKVVMPMGFKNSDKVQEILDTTELALFVETNQPNGTIKLPKGWIPDYEDLGTGLNEAFDEIAKYHEQLGYPKPWSGEEERMAQFREIIVAMSQEVAELCDSFPWKPWREISDQTWDEENAIQELVDIMFFMGSVLELFEISPERFEKMLHWKIAENKNRIQRGYNKSKEDM